jgi:hypothetical protein
LEIFRALDVPLFYFDVRDGDEFIRDDEGLEYPDIEIARDEAARALADMAKDALPGPLVREMAIEVRDSAKEPLLRAALKFEIQRLR